MPSALYAVPENFVAEYLLSPTASNPCSFLKAAVLTLPTKNLLSPLVTKTNPLSETLASPKSPSTKPKVSSLKF